MTLTSKINNIFIVFILVLFLVPNFSFAQESLSLSVSPTLFEMTANPSQKWDSNVRVINSNPYDITVYTEIVNFVPQGETGQPSFVPIDPEEADGQTLAEWLSLESTELVIPAEQTIEIPFVVSVPENAPPGGHFAALLIGTKPPEDGQNVSQLQTSQIVTSLVFLRVTGDVIEDGRIREFRSLSKVAEKPEMSFELRFENRGNVHIVPQGEIKIFNMWGQERGVIPVNRFLLFGNVLPDQIRKYSFSWSGEWSFSDIGRYSAVATLAYGTDSRKFADMETHFWVIPWKASLAVILFVIGFISTITWAIKLYIRKMLSMAGVPTDNPVVQRYPNRSNRKVSVVAPIGEGILDLSNRFKTSSTWKQKLSSVLTFIFRYKTFFAMTVLVISFVILSVIFVQQASVEERGYEIKIDTNGSDITISSEQLQYDELKQTNLDTETSTSSDDFPTLKIINRSGMNGLAAEMRINLESMGYVISDLSSDFGTSERNTVIVYNPEYEEFALKLSKEIDGALLSSFANTPPDEPITIYVGEDYQNNVQ